MEKTRGAHSFRPWVRQGPSSLIVGPYTTVGSSAAVAGSSPSMPIVYPTSAHAADVPAGDAEGSSSVAPSQRRHHTRVGPTPPAPSHTRPSRRAPQPRGPGHHAQGSHLHRDPGRRPLHLIWVLSEPQTCLQGSSSYDLTFPTTSSRGMLAAGIEIFMGRCIMISRHLCRPRAPRLHAPHTTIPSGAIYSVALVLLSSGRHRVLSYDDFQARGQPDCSSFLYRRQARDTSGLRYHSGPPSASGPHQCGRL